jgi:hypothetical protein
LDKGKAESKEGKQRTVLLSQMKAAAEFEVNWTRAAAESEDGKQRRRRCCIKGALTTDVIQES